MTSLLPPFDTNPGNEPTIPPSNLYRRDHAIFNSLETFDHTQANLTRHDCHTSGSPEQVGSRRRRLHRNSRRGCLAQKSQQSLPPQTLRCGFVEKLVHAKGQCETRSVPVPVKREYKSDVLDAGCHCWLGRLVGQQRADASETRDESAAVSTESRTVSRESTHAGAGVCGVCCEREEAFEEAESEVEAEAQFDGGADDNKATQAWRGAQSGIKSGNAVNVADRVRVFEQKRTATSSGSAQTSRKPTIDRNREYGSAAGRVNEETVPLVFPLHVRRFSRRGRNGSPLRPETPLYRSEPEDNAIIHAPLPQRTIPPVKTPVEEDDLAATNTDADDGPQTSAAKEEDTPHDMKTFDPTKTVTADSTKAVRPNLQLSATRWPDTPASSTHKQHINPFVHLHGTRSYCVRHGRKVGNGLKRNFQATRDMFEKGANGSYVPTGYLERRQVEATSPYAVSGLTGPSDGAKFDNDACPDCVAELGIRKRETAESAVPGSTVSFMRQVNALEQPEKLLFGSIDAEPVVQPQQRSVFLAAGFDSGEADSMAVNVASPSDGSIGSEHWKNVRFRNSPVAKSYGTARESENSSEDADDILVTSELGEGLDAVILERGGRLERIILNSQHDTPMGDVMQRLSREIAQVSRAIASAHVGERMSTDGNESMAGERTVVVDSRDGRQRLLSDLLGDIDEAAGGWGLRIRRTDSIRIETESVEPVERHDFAAGQQASSISAATANVHGAVSQMPNLSPDQRIVNRQGIEADYEALREHFDMAGIEGLDRTEHQDRVEANDRLEVRASRWPILQTSPLGANANALSAYPTFSDTSPPPLPRTEPSLDSEDIPIQIIRTSTPTLNHLEPILPSHILTSQDFATHPTRTTTQRASGGSLTVDHPSPMIFTASTCPSMTNSTERSPNEPDPAITTPFLSIPPRTRERDFSFPPQKSAADSTTNQYAAAPALPLPSRAREETKVIRQAMRMELRNKAVQEAAAIERETRKKRQMEAKTMRALEMGERS